MTFSAMASDPIRAFRRALSALLAQSRYNMA
jgi:hypothetical protein